MLESPESTRTQCVAHTLCPNQKFFSFQNQLNLAQPWLHFASESPNSGCHLQMRSTPQTHLSWAFTLFLPHFCTHMPTPYYIPQMCPHVRHAPPQPSTSLSIHTTFLILPYVPYVHSDTVTIAQVSKTPITCSLLSWLTCNLKLYIVPILYPSLGKMKHPSLFCSDAPSPCMHFIFSPIPVLARPPGCRNLSSWERLASSPYRLTKPPH